MKTEGATFYSRQFWKQAGVTSLFVRCDQLHAFARVVVRNNIWALRDFLGTLQLRRTSLTLLAQQLTLATENAVAAANETVSIRNCRQSACCWPNQIGSSLLHSDTHSGCCGGRATGTRHRDDIVSGGRAGIRCAEAGGCNDAAIYCAAPGHSRNGSEHQQAKPRLPSPADRQHREEESRHGNAAGGDKEWLKRVVKPRSRRCRGVDNECSRRLCIHRDCRGRGKCTGGWIRNCWTDHGTCECHVSIEASARRYRNG